MYADIYGIGWVSAAGLGWGERGKIPDFSQLELPALRRKDIFLEPDLRFGRLDPFSKIGLSAITLALRDAEMEVWEQKRDIGLIAATRSGSLSADREYFQTVLAPDEPASPQLFAYTLSTCFLGEASIRFGLTGIAAAIATPEESPLQWLIQALEMLADGEAAAMLAGWCDLPDDFSPYTAAGALFCLLARPGAIPAPPRARVQREPNGTITIANQIITTREQLVRAYRQAIAPARGEQP